VISEKATFGHLTNEKLKAMPFIVPDHNEADEIIIVLDTYWDQIDKAIARNQSTIELIQEYRTALISDAVTGKIDVRGLVS
jgi:type I restriction enzyme, S subunit